MFFFSCVVLKSKCCFVLFSYFLQTSELISTHRQKSSFFRIEDKYNPNFFAIVAIPRNRYTRPRRATQMCKAIWDILSVCWRLSNQTDETHKKTESHTRRPTIVSLLYLDTITNSNRFSARPHEPTLALVPLNSTTTPPYSQIIEMYIR